MEKKPWLFSYRNAILDFAKEEPIFTHDGDLFDFIERWLQDLPMRHYESLWWEYHARYPNIIRMKRGFEDDNSRGVLQKDISSSV